MGQGVGEAPHPLEQRRHRARLRARQAARGRGPVATGRGLPHGGHAQQVGERRAAPTSRPEAESRHRAGSPGHGAQDPLRHRQARGAGTPGDARAHGAGLRLRGGGSPHHGGRPHDHLVDRPAPAGGRRLRAHRHPGPLRGRRRADRGPLGREDGEGARRSPRPARALRPDGAAARSTAPTTSGSSPRSTTCPYLPREEVVRAAEYYRESGADVIDLGCSLDRKFDDVGEVVAPPQGAVGSPSASTPSIPSRSSPPTGPASTTC